MINRISKALSLISLVCLMLVFCIGFANAADGTETQGDIPLYIDNELIGYGYKIGSTTYVPIRAFCEGLGKEVTVNWDSATCTATATMPGLELTASVDSCYITANGRCFYVPNGVRNLNGTVIVPIREIAKAFSVGINWDSATASITIDTSTFAILASADETYDETDLYWLSRIIYSESGNQPLAGKIGVGNVVLNRVASSLCPDTIYDVIFDHRYGVQFSPTTNGTIYKTPNAESVVAAKICLEGYNTVGDSLYFVNPVIGAGGWFARNCTYIATIGEHVFYAV